MIRPDFQSEAGTDLCFPEKVSRRETIPYLYFRILETERQETAQRNCGDRTPDPL